MTFRIHTHPQGQECEACIAETTAAERGKVMRVSQSWLDGLDWCMETIDFESQLDEGRLSMPVETLRQVRGKLAEIHQGIWDETKEADDDDV